MLDLRGLLADIPEMKGQAPGKDQEYANGWGIFAQPFESGDVLALRVFPQNDFSPYRAVWHRDPSGRWAIYVDGSRLDTSCPRYHRRSASDAQWRGPRTTGTAAK